MSAINVVSAVSAAGVAVATAALICVLSVMNGFGRVVEDMFSLFDAPLRVEPTEGKYFRLDDPRLEAVAAMPEVAYFSPTVEETALVEYQNQQVPARIKGVSEEWQALTSIDSIINDGKFEVWDGGFERCVLGRGLASTIGINPHFVGALHVYASKRTGRVNLMRPDKSLVRQTTFIAGTFAVNQVEYDDEVMLTSIGFARTLFDYTEEDATAVEIGLKEGANLKKVQKAMRATLGEDYRVLNRQEQQADFFRISRIEKLLTWMLLVFVLIVAGFNVVGSLSMLMLDKQADSLTLAHLGATPDMLRRIFLYEGWLISTLGAAIGLVVGLSLCLLQEYTGWLKLGNGTDYVLSAYPVEVQTPDVVLVTLMVLLIGFLIARIPVKRFSSPLLLCLLLGLTGLSSCTPTGSAPVKPQENKLFTTGRVRYDGVRFADVGVPYPVCMLDVYSEGVRYDATEKKIIGSGENLTLEQVFLPETYKKNDPLPTDITFFADSTRSGLEGSFLPGIDYDGSVTGAYLLTIADGDVTRIQLLTEGHWDVAYAGDTAVITFHFKKEDGRLYEPVFRGVLNYE